MVLSLAAPVSSRELATGILELAMASIWLAYNELAWTEDLLADPAEYDDEVEVYVDLIKRTAAEPPRTLLHLGSGAGGHDRVFKRHFAVTGVDLSLGMLNKARATHPDIEYLEGDIRTLRLNRQFDAGRPTAALRSRDE